MIESQVYYIISLSCLFSRYFSMQWLELILERTLVTSSWLASLSSHLLKVCSLRRLFLYQHLSGRRRSRCRGLKNISKVLMVTGLYLSFSFLCKSFNISLFYFRFSSEGAWGGFLLLLSSLCLKRVREILATKKLLEKKEPIAVKIIIIEPSKPPTSPKKSNI